MIPQKQKPYQQRKHFDKKKKFDRPKGPPPFDVLLRKFKKKVERAGTLQEVRKREYFEKPAQVKQRKKKEAIRKEEIRWQSDQLTRRTRFY